MPSKVTNLEKIKEEAQIVSIRESTKTKLREEFEMKLKDEREKGGDQEGKLL